MKFFVSEECIGCSLCAGTCPEVFHMSGEGHAEAVPDDADAFADAALEAEAGCPVGAIRHE